jgi:hypothetical protein
MKEFFKVCFVLKRNFFIAFFTHICGITGLKGSGVNLPKDLTTLNYFLIAEHMRLAKLECSAIIILMNRLSP